MFLVYVEDFFMKEISENFLKTVVLKFQVCVLVKKDLQLLILELSGSSEDNSRMSISSKVALT